METATTTKATFTLKCDCGEIKEVSVYADQIVFCNKCSTRLTGKHFIN